MESLVGGQRSKIVLILTLASWNQSIQVSIWNQSRGDQMPKIHTNNCMESLSGGGQRPVIYLIRALTNVNSTVKAELAQEKHSLDQQRAATPRFHAKHET